MGHRGGESARPAPEMPHCPTATGGAVLHPANRFPHSIPRSTWTGQDGALGQIYQVRAGERQLPLASPKQPVTPHLSFLSG